jgi:hypothetical protein
MPPKAKAAAAKRAARVAALGAQVALGHALDQKEASMKDSINKYLDARPEQVEACLVMLQQGYCDPAQVAKQDVELTIPDSNTTLEHLASKVLVPAIHSLHPELFTHPLLAKLRKGRKQLKHLFQFLVQEIPSSPVPTHNVADFCSMYKDRYELLGKRGQHLKISDDGCIDWGKSGTFSLDLGEGQTPTKYIVHISGTKAPLVLIVMG